MRSLLLIALLLSAAWTSRLDAQQVPPLSTGPGRITGTVVDPDAAPLPGVAITLRSAEDSAVVTGVMTGAEGRFVLESLPVGTYLVRVSYIGYKPRDSEPIEITAASPRTDLGTIALEVSAVALDAVVAEAERSAVIIEADRTIYSTREMPIASTGTATDVLRAVPELEVDVDNNVKLRGNQPVAIHLNGRPAPLRGEQLANFLEQLPGDRIERVEVMPNPSARHDPEGMGGIVNIVLKEDLDLGLSGSLSANASTRNRQYGNGRLNYQRGRLTLFSGAGANRFNANSSTWDLRQNLVADPVTVIEQTGTAEDGSNGWNLDWTAELRVGERGTLWSNAWMYASDGASDGVTTYEITDEARTPGERYDRIADTERGWRNYNLGFGFKQVFEPQKRELTIDGRVMSGGNDMNSMHRRLTDLMGGEPVEMPVELTLNDIDTDNGELSLQADYFAPLAGGRLDVGYRASRRTQESDNRLDVYASEDDSDPATAVHSGFEFEETFHSAYTTYSHTFGRFGVQGGLRAERADTRFSSRVTGDEFERPYTTLYPSANLSYTSQPGRTIRLLYARRINRPHPYYLDPAVPATDPLNRYLGNPELRPSHVHSVTLDASITGRLGTLRVAPYYRYSSDVWERIRTVDEDGVATSRWENAASSRAYGSSFTISLPPSGRLTGSTSFSLYRDERDGTNLSEEYQRAAVMWSLGGNVGIKLRETLTAQVYANHFPQQSILQGRASGYTWTSLSLRQQVFDRKGSISVSINDPLNLNSFDSSTRDATHIQESRSSFTSRMVSVGLTFNFGKPPQQQSRRAAPEEQGETIRVR